MRKAPKRSASERKNYIDDFVTNTILVPGPGNYNPKKIVPPIKINSTTPSVKI